MNWQSYTQLILLLQQKELTSETEMRIAREMGTRDLKSPQPGTTTAEIVNWLERNGFAVASGHDGSLELLRRYLNKGIPVLVGVLIAIAVVANGGDIHGAFY